MASLTKSPNSSLKPFVNWWRSFAPSLLLGAGPNNALALSLSSISRTCVSRLLQRATNESVSDGIIFGSLSFCFVRLRVPRKEAAISNEVFNGLHLHDHSF